MTTVVTTAQDGPLTANGVTPIPFTFQSVSETEIEVLREGAVVSPAEYLVTREDDGTGSITPLLTWGSDEIYIRSAPDLTQPTLFQRFGAFYPDQINAPLDRLARSIIGLKDWLMRFVADYVASTPGPSGTVELSGIAWVTPQQFGAVADGVTDDYPAFVAAIAHLKTIANEPYVSWFYKGSPRLYVPAATEDYYLSETLDITHTLIIEGEGGTSGMASRLRFADNKTGIRIQGYNTSGAAGVDIAPFHYSGAGTTIRNLGIIGGVVDSEAGLVGGEGEYHGIHLRSGAIIEDVYINGFRGDGIFMHTSVGGGGADEGNANNTSILRPRLTNVRNGINIDGADANACVIIGVNATYCRQWTVWDSSFLGNTHIGHHSANAGLVPGVPSTITSHGGNWYAVRAGQAVGASANAPSGTTADNTWWYYMGAGTPNALLNVPAWVNGVSVREGGSYCTDSANGYNEFIGCYSEGGEAPAQFVLPTLVLGGLLTVKTTGALYAGSQLDIKANPAFLGPTIASATAGPSLICRNSSGLSGGVEARFQLAAGNDDADGTALAEVGATATSATPNSNEPTLNFSTRAFTTGTMTVRFSFSTASNVFYPATDKTTDLGGGSNHWGDAYVKSIKVNNIKVLGAQGAAIANATDAASAITQLNLLLAAARTHGIIAT